jgi:hypothetical protein
MYRINNILVYVIDINVEAAGIPPVLKFFFTNLRLFYVKYLIVEYNFTF